MDLERIKELAKRPWLTYEEAMEYAGYKNENTFRVFLSKKKVDRNPGGYGTINTESLRKALNRPEY